ncbi:MAG TPA: radical SAM protein [Nitriliruptorales bacterium]|nr:radical SAM protein [Nitriliruptorales bacterium]
MATVTWPVPVEVDGGGRFRQRRDDHVPAYVAAHEAGLLVDRAQRAADLLAPCSVCPRPCRDVDRLADQLGACRIGRHARVASAFPHFGEEDVLRGWRGSGTIFMAGCNLRCVFCQNGDISQRPVGREVTASEMAALMLDLQARGCHNINIVTPEHVVPQLLEALPIAVERGLRLPLVYNTSAYDSLDSIDLLDGVVDVYMPDVKLWDPAHCHRYLGVRDYPEVARRVVAAMYAQVGDLVVDEDGLALRGLMVRHLVMPGLSEDGRAIVGFLAGLSTDMYLNVMDQYRSEWKVATTDRYGEIDRRVTSAEFADVMSAARAAGLWRLDRRWRHIRRRSERPPPPAQSDRPRRL